MSSTKSKYHLPKGYSLLQTALKTPAFLKHPLNFIQGNMKKFDGTYSISMGLGSNIILTQDPDFINYVLKENHRNYVKKGFAVERSVKYIGNGLVFSDGDYWRRQRRVLQPAFHKDKIRKLGANVLQTIETNLSSYSEGEKVDICPTTKVLVFKILLKSLFDIELTPKILSTFSEGFEEAQAFLIRDINFPLARLFYPINGAERKMVKKIEQLRGLFRDIINERKASKGEFSDILDMLIHSRYEDTGEAMSEEKMIDELIIFISAGHETTANTINWILYLLAANPDAQEKLYHLVANQPTAAVANHVYLQAIIQEGMRLYSTTWSTQRVAATDDQFKEYAYPKGTVIVPFFFGLHRAEALWKEAQQFQPERFIAGEKIAKFKHFFPFGAGPRMCIGNHFALMEMAYFLTEFVKTYQIKTTGQLPETEAMLTMSPDKVELNIKYR